MSLITTAGDANADSYAAVADASAYFTARGITTWGAATIGTKEAALRRATTYLDNQYRDRWVGIRTNETQSLAWPRLQGVRGFAGGVIENLYDLDGFAIASDVVPTQVVRACIEAALLVITGVTLEPRLDRGGDIKSISKGVGPLSKSITYADGAPVLDRHIVIEGLLRGLVKSTPGASSGTVQIVRS